MAGSASSVRTVATISPPMMETAIGPQKTEDLTLIDLKVKIVVSGETAEFLV
jgi:hypothetical protein